MLLGLQVPLPPCPLYQQTVPCSGAQLLLLLQEADLLRLVELYLASIPPAEEPAPRVPASVTALPYQVQEQVVREDVRWDLPPCAVHPVQAAVLACLLTADQVPECHVGLMLPWVCLPEHLWRSEPFFRLEHLGHFLLCRPPCRYPSSRCAFKDKSCAACCSGIIHTPGPCAGCVPVSAAGAGLSGAWLVMLALNPDPETCSRAGTVVGTPGQRCSGDRGVLGSNALVLS